MRRSSILIAMAAPFLLWCSKSSSTDTDPCLPNPCTEPHRSLCSVEDGIAVCGCDAGFTLEGDRCVGEPICEAPQGFACFYVSTTGDDSNDGSFDSPFRTIQHAVDSMGGGDYIYLRQGVYDENVDLPQSKNGVCSDRRCTEGSWSTIKSYPNEWAVIDGGHRELHVIGHWHSGSGSGTLPDGTFDVLPDGTWGELPSGTFGGLADLHFWKLEHLEITGGCLDEGGGGFTASGGPFWIRYVYFHENQAQSRDANPGAIRGYTWHDSIVEYCRFQNNGCTVVDGNCADINIFSDYADSRHGWTREYWEANGPHTITYATRNNEYRFNLFEGTPVGIKHKNDQILCDRSGSDFRYAELGDKIHHNILFDNPSRGILAYQDFAQVHHNILVRSLLSNDEYHGLDMRYITTYNNLVLENKIEYFVPYYGPDESDWSQIIIHFHPFWYCMNNIVELFANEWDAASISAGVAMDKDDSGDATVDLADAIIDRNYVYRSHDETHFRIGRNAGPCSDWLTADQVNDCYSTNNYANPLDEQDPLHQGESGSALYKTRHHHLLNGSATISNGGMGTSHPYLVGVFIPSYVGPCPDDECVWVDDVLDLADPQSMVERR